jgi:hypothetical protein
MTDAAPTTEAPASRDIPIVSDALRVLRVPFSPGAVFSEMVAKPAWFVPWLTISLICVLIGILTLPYTERIMDIAMATRAQGQQIPAAAKKIGMIFAFLGLPILALFLSLIGALIMWVTLMLSGGKVRFSGLLSASVFAKVMLAFQSLITVLIWKMRGAPAAAIQTMADAQVAIGADLLLPGDNPVSPFLRVLLGAINPLSIWGLVITAIGVMVLEKQSKGSAWTAVIVAFAILVLISAVLAGKQPQ